MHGGGDVMMWAYFEATATKHFAVSVFTVTFFVLYFICFIFYLTCTSP